jgi:hypothetical protein
MKRSALNGGLLLMAFLFVCTFSMAQATVTGRCTDKSGVPLKGVQVTAILFDERKTVETDGDGNYQHPNLGQGNWTLVYQNNSEKIVKKVAVKSMPVEMNVTFGAESKQ